MIHYVYAIVNSKGEYEHIGETKNPQMRLCGHKSNVGKFHNRNDIEMEILDHFYSKKEAYNRQIELQNEYGLKNDNQIRSENIANRWKK